MKPIFFPMIAAAAILTLSGCKPAAQPELSDWAVKTQADLQAAHNIMLENHPGPKDVRNPKFNKQANASLENAMNLATRVTDEAEYGAALLAYTAGFRDGHFGVFSKAHNTGGVDYFWPGMLPAWRAGQVRISHTEPAQSELLGSEILSCDDRPVKELILEHVFQFDTGKPDQDSYWARKSHQLFLSSGNPFISRLENCDFRLTSGETVKRPLNWQKAGDEVFHTLRWKTAFGMRPKIGMTEIRPGEFWINLPDFSPDEAGIAQNRAIFAEIIQRRAELRDTKSIVIDMRGNQGGASTWGGEMIEALWGEAYPLSREVDHGTYVEWRLSDGNITNLKDIFDYLIENGHEEMANDYFSVILEGAKLAHAQGDDLYKEPDFNDPDDETVEKQNNVTNPVKTPVYLLTHGTCVSACLDFADALFELEGVTHIGYPTGSDTNYMEIRQQDLPSGLGVIAIPTKVYRNRARKSGAYYEPLHQYDGFDWSDEAIHAWAKTVTQP
ncbi:MAG: S41 family peptidase [Hellea sp.]